MVATRPIKATAPTADPIPTPDLTDPTAALLFPSGEERALNVIEALLRVMRDLPAIGKDDRAAPEQGGYAYRGIEGITKHAQILFAKHGVVFVPSVESWERDEVIVGRDKAWHDDRLRVTYTVYGPGGADDNIVVGPIAAIGRDGADKGTNKCMTQAFKYALLQVLCISDKADDNDGVTVEADYASPADPENDPITREQIAAIRSLVRDLRAVDADTADTIVDDNADGTVVLGVQILSRNDGTTRPATTEAIGDDLVGRLGLLLVDAQAAAPSVSEADAAMADKGVGVDDEQ